MEKVLFISQVDADGLLPKSAFETLTATVQLSQQMAQGEFSIGLFGKSTTKAAGQLGKAGAKEIFSVEGEAFEFPRYASDVAAMTSLAKQAQATLILAANTSRIARCLGGAARRLNGAIDTKVNGISVENETLNIKRWYYRQRMMGCLSKKARPWFLSVDSGVFAPWSGEPAETNVTSLEVSLDDAMTQTTVVSIEKPACDAQTIRPDSPLLFVAGAGWTKKQSDGQIHIADAEALIKGFLQQSGASLGSSKSLVDQSSEGQKVISFMSHLNQVGQTGASPRHSKGLATCCHGEEPHVVGWRFINERRAVNMDANCGWARGKADVVYVADAFAVMEKVNELLKN